MSKRLSNGSLVLIALTLSLLLLVQFQSANAKNLQQTYDCAAQTSLPQGECEVLVDFYHTTNGDAWFDNTGWLTGDVCDWYGIDCLGGHVSGIVLGYNNLNGPFTADFSGFTGLLSVGLATNQLTGDIPTIIGNMPTGLEVLHLKGNEINGEIPTEISNLTQMAELDLSGNQISGTIPSSITTLTDLWWLALGNNQLTGTIPSSISSLINLQMLDLGGNSLNGDMAAIIAYLPTGLGSLYLDNNQFSGTIPAEISNLINLTSLNLGNNELTGDAATIISNLPTGISVLYLESNLFTGTIPAGISSLINLKQLNLANNQLVGDLAAIIGYLPLNLRYLNLYNNDFTGTIPSAISGFANLETLSVSGNQLTGDMAAIIGYLPGSIEYLGLGSNQFTGTIPASISGLTRLDDLSVGGNELTGDMATIIGNLTTGIQTLDLSGNNFTGTIPSTISTFSYLWIFNVGSNQLAGDMATIIDNLPSQVSLLHLDNNQFTGTIPASIASLPLFFLDVGGNDLTGDLGTIIGNLPIEIFDLYLDNNDFTGTIPSSISSFSNLRNFYVGGNQITGNLSSIIGYLPSTIELLYLDNNQLDGTIPAAIANLSDLVEFDISINSSITGTIPMEITTLALDYFNFAETYLCEPDDPAYDTWKAGVPEYFPGICGFPANDLMINATEVTGLPYTDTVDTTDAALEAGEPEYTCGSNVDHTVWYRYTPEADGIFVVDTIGSDFFNTIHVYEDLGGGSLLPVDCNAFSYDGLAQTLSIDGVAGTSYLISLGGLSNRSGNLVVNISQPGPFVSCAAVDIPQAECEALVDLYTATNGAAWTNNVGWLATDRVCAWHGVSCSAGRVETIYMPANNLVGPLSADFSGFSNLLGIELSENQLDGDFAAIPGNLPPDLEVLYLESNNLTGTIPDTIAGLTNLVGFKAGGNPLVGDLSTIIDYLPPSIFILYLDNTQISGTIPDSIAKFPEFFDLNLSYNSNMGGTISMGITNVIITSTFNFEGTNLCEPDDPAYDDWQELVWNYIPGPCNAGPPDLVIDGITITPENPQSGETITVTVHARNAGEDLDDSLVVDLFIDSAPDVCNDGYLVQVFDRFSGNTTLDVEYQLTGLSPGDHEIYAYLDTMCNVAESNEENNGFGPVPIYVSKTPPVIEILSPLDKSAFHFNAPITLVGSATDAEDGDISSLISWSSDLDGAIGIGQEVIFTSTTPGNHVITAEITDSHGDTAQASIKIRIFENRPPVAIFFNPEAPEGVVGEWFKSVSMFGDKNGAVDLTMLQVHLDAGVGNPNSLNVQYLVDANELYLQEASTENWIGPCTPGDVGTLSNGNAEINCKLTMPYTLGDHFIKLRVLARWVQPIDASIVMDVFLRATDRYGNDSGFKPKGTWTLLP